MKKIVLILLLFIISACSSPKQYNKLRTHKYAKPVDTSTRPVEYQQKGAFLIAGVGASTNFPAARLNKFERINDSLYQATILSENSPINPSPWYAFKIWAKEKRTLSVNLDYGEFKHRYNPKISKDGERWIALDSTYIERGADSTSAIIKLDIDQDTLWVAAQEIQDTKRVKSWVDSFKDHKMVTLGLAGLSAQERPLLHMNITRGANDYKPTIIVISRQHPPEVTGFFAMKAFIETLIEEGGKNGFFDKYRVMVYPLMNPDGADLGHFRHNTGGVDLNRDWSVYNQPEIAQITQHMVNEVKEHKNNVLLGLDFHSTYYDVYYTPHESVKRKIPDFTKTWLEQIRVALDIEDINESPGKGERPTSSAWFNRQFGATGITYEIGDDTPREFIKQKGEVSAQAMMDYFLKLK
ncbi:M14 family metallopeptidase [Maribacter sp. HTCC2170]|uniref:M14 family metallopeptidase n=1 Tax=Maribacter sp. (strain HTCC2170 / KCCM 42371) TaxID=313603 RepID=UPI00006AFD53|nr:M14 family metallopeptidase [Maribacter sp. HTCC2170]